jgi:nitroimidazol reductase NimA-like FMN-containing flavoprotein (pyridoxamine 5'-phosphate oxidase superfamily)
MNKIRYTQRDCKDREKIETFLLRVRTGVIGMVSDDFPYAVPVNFVWHDGAVYFHGMGSGKKEDILIKDSRVCFTVYEEYGTVTDPVPCHADTSYMSVMLFGEAKKITDSEAAAAVLQKLIKKFMPEFYNHPLNGKMIEKYRSSLDGNAVSVYRMTVHEMTAKENSVDTGKLFKMESNA